MNAVEIEEAVSRLAEAPFAAAEFPYFFLEAFGNKETTLRRLRSDDSNQSRPARRSPAAEQYPPPRCAPRARSPPHCLHCARVPRPRVKRPKFILATDGKSFEAENLADGGTVACAYADFPDHFGYFLPLAGITTVKQIRESSFDIKATGRLNRLYIELLKDNPDWGTDARREDLNHFMARLIFCFFAEDTDIFHGQRLFTLHSSRPQAPFTINQGSWSTGAERHPADLSDRIGRLVGALAGMIGRELDFQNSIRPKFDSVEEGLRLRSGSTSCVRLNNYIESRAQDFNLRALSSPGRRARRNGSSFNRLDSIDCSVTLNSCW